MIIKLALLLALAGALIMAYRTALDARSSAIRRVAGFLVFSLGCVAVVRPDWISVLAGWLGVGRGADLLLYAFVITSLFVWLGLYRRLHELEHRVSVLATAISLANSSALTEETDQTTGHT